MNANVDSPMPSKDEVQSSATGEDPNVLPVSLSLNS